MNDFWEVLPIILGTTGVTGLVAVIVTAMFNRRKLKAETTDILTNAAGGIIKNLQDDNQVLREQQAKSGILEWRRSAAERARDATFRVALEAHYNYDLDLARALRDAGIEIADPPRITFPDYEYDRVVE